MAKNLANDRFIQISMQQAASESFSQPFRANSLLYQQRLRNNQGFFKDLQLARERAAFARWRTLENLDKYLIEFESNFNRRGGKVIWALDAKQACQEIQAILKKQGSSQLLQSKSNTADEIGLNEFLKENGFSIFPTDLGDHLVKADADNSSHPILPALHYTESQAAASAQPWGLSPSADAESITHAFRDLSREKFQSTKVALSGANFLVAESGSVVTVENEGNIRMGLTTAKVQIVLAGIDKLITSLSDLDLFIPLLSLYGTGSQQNTYTTITNGPRYSMEQDGPEEMYVILLDNGRSEVLAQFDQRQALSCIHCGACHSHCPVFRLGGMKAYPAQPGGPIGMVTAPFQFPDKDLHFLSQASTLCGACTEVCPVNIPIHQLLIDNRKGKKTGKSEGFFWKNWKTMMLSRRALNNRQRLKGMLFQFFFKKKWNQHREFPQPAAKSFNQLWREEKGIQ